MTEPQKMKSRRQEIQSLCQKQANNEKEEKKLIQPKPPVRFKADLTTGGLDLLF